MHINNLNGWQRLWVMFSIVWAILVLIFTINALPEKKSEINSRWVKEKIDILKKSHGQSESTAEYRQRRFGNASDEEIINFRPDRSGGFDLSSTEKGIDYSKISTADLENIKDGNLAKVSTQTLEYLQKQAIKATDQKPDIFDKLLFEEYDAINQKYKSHLTEQQTRSRLQTILLGLLVWSAPMIAIYLMGIGIHWVHVGFLNKPPE